ncbi:MAG: GtrA family protein [Firmicutes bacterium]|nr:GtrA family protein [Bacillota bacterium]
MREPATFYAVGALNTAVDLALFALLSRALAVPYLIAQVVSYGAGAADSYLLNRAVTFRRCGRPPAMEAVRFALVNAASLLAATAVLFVAHGLGGLALLPAKALATGAGALLNYGGNRSWVFGPAPGAPPPGGRPRLARRA